MHVNHWEVLPPSQIRGLCLKNLTIYGDMRLLWDSKASFPISPHLFPLLNELWKDTLFALTFQNLVGHPKKERTTNLIRSQGHSGIIHSYIFVLFPLLIYFVCLGSIQCPWKICRKTLSWSTPFQQSAKTNLNVEQVFFSIARDIRQRLAESDTKAEVLDRNTQFPCISLFLVHHLHS